MNAKQWHYALDGEQKGPVSADDFERLISAGVVGRDTLVWTDGMAAWETLAQVRPDTAPPPVFPSPDSPSIPGAGQAVCEHCGQVVSTKDVPEESRRPAPSPPGHDPHHAVARHQPGSAQLA
jgi:hypothetical protein